MSVISSVRVALAAFFLLISSLVYADTISIRADEWYPINGVPGSADPGYMIEIAQKIMQPLGHTIDYKVMPWERSISKVREGAFDCVVGAYVDDAPDFKFPDQPWGMIESKFYVKKGETWKYEGIDSLSKVMIGVIGGYAYSEEFDAYVEANKDSGKVQIVKANNALEQNIKKLMAGRINTLLESHLVMDAKLKSMGLSDKVVQAGSLGAADSMYIACSPAKASSEKYIKQFSDGLRSLRKSGELKKILDKYGLKDWQ